MNKDGPNDHAWRAETALARALPRRHRAFIERLEDRGFLCRLYASDAEKRCADLFTAARALHNHLCMLDAGNQLKAGGLTLAEFVNIFAELEEVSTIDEGDAR